MCAVLWVVDVVSKRSDTRRDVIDILQRHFNRHHFRTYVILFDVENIFVNGLLVLVIKRHQ